MSFLVKFAATNLYDYVLDTEDLSVIRGASNQLDDFVGKVPGALKRAGITVEVVYVGASEILLDVDTNPDAAEEVIVKLLHDELKIATGAVASVELNDTKGDLAKSMIRLEAKLRRAQLASPSVIPPPKCIGSKACEIEGVRPAGSHRARADREEVSDHTYQRYQRGREFRTRLLDQIFVDQSLAAVDTTEWEQSFEGLQTLNAGSTQSLRSKMCVMHADGNSFGKCREHLTEARQLTDFSKLVEQSLFETLRNGLSSLLDRGKALGILPFHILYLAGDEFALVFPAVDAVRVARALLSGFSTAVAERLESPEYVSVKSAIKGTLTLSVGMVICDTHEPIQRATALARDLCEGAKEHVKDAFAPEAGNVIDFAVIESGFLPGSAGQHRKQSRTCEWNTVSNGGSTLPIRVAPLTRVAFDHLVEGVKTLKEADFPTSRMHRFCRVIRESTTEKDMREACFATYQRIASEVKKKLDGKHIMPQSPADCSPASPFVISWFDRKAIWDYVL